MYTLHKLPFHTSERTSYVWAKSFKAIFLHTFRVHKHKNCAKDSNPYELLSVT